MYPILFYAVLCLSLLYFQLFFNSTRAEIKEVHSFQRSVFGRDEVVVPSGNDMKEPTRMPVIQRPRKPTQSSDLRSFCQGIAKNNTIMVSYTDEGYLPFFDLFYRVSHLEQYSNFFVAAADMYSYQVLLFHRVHCRT